MEYRNHTKPSFLSLGACAYQQSYFHIEPVLKGGLIIWFTGHFTKVFNSLSHSAFCFLPFFISFSLFLSIPCYNYEHQMLLIALDIEMDNCDRYPRSGIQGTPNWSYDGSFLSALIRMIYCDGRWNNSNLFTFTRKKPGWSSVKNPRKMLSRYFYISFPSRVVGFLSNCK